MAIEWRDSALECSPEGEPMELIDILVHNGDDRIPLANITNLGSSPRSAGTEKRGKKWRRQAHNKADKLGTSELRKGQTGIEESK